MASFKTFCSSFLGESSPSWKVKFKWVLLITYWRHVALHIGRRTNHTWSSQVLKWRDTLLNMENGYKTTLGLRHSIPFQWAWGAKKMGNILLVWVLNPLRQQTPSLRLAAYPRSVYYDSFCGPVSHMYVP